MTNPDTFSYTLLPFFGGRLENLRGAVTLSVLAHDLGQGTPCGFPPFSLRRIQIFS